MALHPPLFLLGGSERISDRPEEHPRGCGAYVLELVLKILLDIRSRYPWSSFGGIAFHPGIGTATLFALFMPTFAAVLAPFERVVTNAAFHSLERKAATVPFTEKWTGWDLNPRPLPCQDSDLPADLPARDALY